MAWALSVDFCVQHQQNSATASSNRMNNDMGKLSSSSSPLSSPESETSLAASESGDSVCLNPTTSVDDSESIALLRQIFPGESSDALRRLHYERLAGHNTTPERPIRSTSPSSSTIATTPSTSYPQHGNHHQQQQDEDQVESRQQSPPLIHRSLPESLNRLPSSHNPVEPLDTEEDLWRCEMVEDLENRVIQQTFLGIISHRRSLHESKRELGIFSRIIFRDERVGLGLTLREEDGIIRVHSLSSVDGRQWYASPPDKRRGSISRSEAVIQGPCLQAGIEAGDVLLGINGFGIAESHQPGVNLLWHVVETLQSAPSPVVLHFQRPTTALLNNNNLQHNHDPHTPPRVVSLAYRKQSAPPALLDDTHSTIEEVDDSRCSESDMLSSLSDYQQQQHPYYPQQQHTTFYSTPLHDYGSSIHPLAQKLATRGVIDATEQVDVTAMMSSFTERTRKWEAMSSLHIVSSSPNKHYGMTTQDSDVFVPMMGVRKALCVRILNSFLDGNRMAYTIWVYDVEAGREWYAPVRYFGDFQDLRHATISLQPSIGRLPFPKQQAKLARLFGSPLKAETSAAEQDAKSRQLEHFLRSLCSMIYRGNVHPAIAEVAIHVQSFLGCDDEQYHDVRPPCHIIHGSDSTRSSIEAQTARFHLKRSLQLYTYRVFLLSAMSQMVDSFVDTVRSRAPGLQEIESLEAQGRSSLKTKALDDLTQIQSFLDSLQSLILDCCMEDFQSIAQREEYQAIHDASSSPSGTHKGAQPPVVFWDRLVREAVREQIEIEVYVPLRSVASRWLVNGWRHEDMEVHFKINELRKRPIDFFRIPATQEAASSSSVLPSNEASWQSAAAILKRGAGQSTLPCIKLRAIVDAAREISRAFGPTQQNGGSVEENADGGESNLQLGADQFLPIFIYCVVQAEMERPCALCVLLRTLCDPINKIGEIGYYLASFEAAVTHIQEIDLSDDPQRMRSFLHVNLDGD